MNDVFSHPVTIYSDDTDCYGMVYHSNFLRYMDHARSEWLKHHAQYNLQQLVEMGFYFVIYSAELRFHRPVRLSDCILIECQLAEQSASSLTFSHRVVQAHDPNILNCSGQVKLAYVNTEGKPAKLPEHFTRDLI